MNDLIDNVSRILATPMPRRKALRLFGGALAAAVVAVAGIQPLSAAKCNKAALTAGSRDCGTGSSSQCCPTGTCCASNVKGVSACCGKGTCYCNTTGTCGASTGGHCPTGCSMCA
jgi:hypothetical protein